MRFAQNRLFNAAMLDDPYPIYKKLRTEDPVHWDEAENRWVLSRYADVAAILRSPLASSKRPQAAHWFIPPSLRQLAALRCNSMINCDGPRHNQLRQLVSKAFTARCIEAMTGDIQTLVDGFLDAVQPAGRMDLMSALACPLPVTVIAQMLGVAPEDRDQFKSWSDDLSVVAGGNGGPGGLRLGDYRRAANAYTGLKTYFSQVVADRKVRPQNDLLTALAQAQQAEVGISEDDVYANATLLLTAGHETTTNLIGNGMLALLHHPDQLDRLRRDPSLIPTAIEEMLRYDSPVQFTSRILTGYQTVGGRRLRKGQTVLLLLGAANRDPKQFEDPDRFDVGRQDNKHLSFALGSHFCLGAQLARLEGRIAVETLLRRMPGLRLEGPQPRYREHFNLRGLKSLPVAF